jgi:hypothetical protein
MSHEALQLELSVPPRIVAGARQQTPVEQLFVPEQARLDPVHMAVAWQLSPRLVAQQTSVAESHVLPLQAICPGPPSVPRGGVVVPPGPPVSPPSSPPVGAASSPPVVASSPPLPLELVLPLEVPPLEPPEPELPPAPLLPPELLFDPPSLDAEPPEPLHPARMIAAEAVSNVPNVRSADIEVPPRTFFTVISRA